MKSLIQTKQDKILIPILVLTAVAITVTGIIFSQTFLNILPLYVSLVVYILQARITRIAHLVGAINSLFYAVVYIRYSLYASAASAVLISFTMQIITYFLWKKRKSGSTTEFRRLPTVLRIVIPILYVIALILTYLYLPYESDYKFLDLAHSLLSFVSPFLTMFAFIEYAPLMIYSQCICICLYSMMLRSHPEQSTYLVFACYGLVCQSIATKNVFATYKKQQKEKNCNQL